MVKTVRINNSDFSFSDRLSACIGFFDGMHRGHQCLMKETISYAEMHHIYSALICFDPDPYDVLNDKHNTHIFSQEQRLKLVEEFGFDYCIIIHFTEEVMRLDPKVFIERYLNRMNLEYLVYGFDFRFGYQGKGDGDTLKEYGSFQTEMIPECSCYRKKISSTRIKENLKKGNFRLVNRLLGFDYRLTLKVINSSETGQKWLTEAIPYYDDVLIPKEGVYRDLFTIRNGRFYIETDRLYRTGEKLEITVRQ